MAKLIPVLLLTGYLGSGKTTLLNCISTIDAISAGKILLDGVSVADLSEHELAKFRRERLGFVFQDFNLLDTLTIEENIGLALSLNHQNPGTVQNRVREVAGKLSITDILTKFPYQVSGGQKQRISVARAVLKPAEIFIFDDSTSALDLKTEAALYRALKESHPDSTKIIIAQRIATVRSADRIVVLENGGILACGTHEELMGSCRAYQDIWHSQMGEEAKGA